MNFLSILKGVGRVAVGIEHVAAPIIATAGGPAATALVNLLDPVFQRLVAAPLAVEIQTANVTTKPPGFNEARAAAVTNDFESALDLTRDILAMNGFALSYDMAKLRAANDCQVAAYKAMADLKASFKLVPLAPTAIKITKIDPPEQAVP